MSQLENNTLEDNDNIKSVLSCIKLLSNDLTLTQDNLKSCINEINELRNRLDTTDGKLSHQIGLLTHERQTHNETQLSLNKLIQDNTDLEQQVRHLHIQTKELSKQLHYTRRHTFF